MELHFTGEDFLRTLRGAVADELMEEADHSTLVTNQDIDYEMGNLAIWLVQKYFRQKYEVSEDKD